MNSLFVLYLSITSPIYLNPHYGTLVLILPLEIYLEPPVLYTLVAENPC